MDGCLEMGAYKLDMGVVRIHYFSVCYLENTETFLRFVSPFTILPTAEVSPAQTPILYLDDNHGGVKRIAKLV